LLENYSLWINNFWWILTWAWWRS